MARTSAQITPAEQIMIGELAGIANSNYVYKNSSGVYVGAAITPLSGYTITNPTVNRVLDEASTTLTGLAQTVGTLIGDISILGGGVGWGSTTAGTSGTGVALTVSNSSSASTIGQSITIGNTQTQVVTGLKIDTGTSAKAHTGLLINANNTASTKAVSIDLGTTGTGNGIYIAASTTSSPGANLFYIEQIASGTLNNRAVDTAGIANIRVHTGATSISSSYNNFLISRVNTINNAGGAITEAGTVLKLQNSLTVTAGTATDTIDVLSIVQSTLSSGNAIKTTGGSISIGDMSAPVSKTNKLYAVGGDLYWNGTKLN